MFVCEWDLPSGHPVMVSVDHIQINHRHPAVRDDLYAWGSWILDVCSCNWQPSFVYSDAAYQVTGGGGFRLDAIKHIDRRFMFEFVRVERKSGDFTPSRARFILDSKNS